MLAHRLRCLTAGGLTALGGTLPLWCLLARLGDDAGSRAAGVVALLAAVLAVAASAAATLSPEPQRDADRPA